jgi:hypothetical protein
LRLWNLKAKDEPAQTMIQANDLVWCGKEIYASSIIKVCPSRVYLGSYFGLSSTGEMAMVTMSNDMVDDIVPHK